MSDKIKRLELGPGGRRIHKPIDTDINIAIDFYDYEGSDIEIPDWDLRYGLPFGQTAQTNHGPVLIEKGIFDDIYAEHVLEHIPRPVDPEDDMRIGFWKLMVDCYDALKVDGTLRGAVPSWPDPTAVLDPTHVVFGFRPETFSYFGWHSHLDNNVIVGWVPGFTPKDNRVFEPVEIKDWGNQIGFTLRKMK